MTVSTAVAMRIRYAAPSVARSTPRSANSAARSNEPDDDDMRFAARYFSAAPAAAFFWISVWSDDRNWYLRFHDSDDSVSRLIVASFSLIVAMSRATEVSRSLSLASSAVTLASSAATWFGGGAAASAS